MEINNNTNTTTNLQKKSVWLDCDPGHDDAMAIFMAATHPSLKLLGISTVHGNSSIDNVTRNALGLLRAGGLEASGVRVYKGLGVPIARELYIPETFHGEDGFGSILLPDTSDLEAVTGGGDGVEDVIRSIYAAIRDEYLLTGAKVHFVAIGCLSNLAVLLRSFPDVKECLEQVVFMGGSSGFGNVRPAAEWNMYADPEAAEYVLGQDGLRIVMVPLDLTHKVEVLPAFVERVERLNTPFAHMVTASLLYFAESYKMEHKLNPPLHDPVAVYYVIDPEAYTSKFLNVVVETQSKYCDGRTEIDLFGNTRRKPNVHVALDVVTSRFWEAMYQAILDCNMQSPMNFEKPIQKIAMTMEKSLVVEEEGVLNNNNNNIK